MRRKRGIEKGRTCKISPTTWTSLLLSIVSVEEEKDLEGEVVCVSVSFESIFSTSTSVACHFKGGSQVANDQWKESILKKTMLVKYIVKKQKKKRRR